MVSHKNHCTHVVMLIHIIPCFKITGIEFYYIKVKWCLKLILNAKYYTTFTILCSFCYKFNLNVGRIQL